MKQTFLTFAALTIIASIAYYTLTHADHKEVERLQYEHTQLEARNAKMRRANADLEQQVVALRDDPRLAEKKARESGGLAKPHELVYQFDDPADKDLAVSVKLSVSPSKLELAGKPVSVSALPAELDQLAARIPDAHLQVVYDEALGPIARQRIQDILSKSPLSDTAH